MYPSAEHISCSVELFGHGEDGVIERWIDSKVGMSRKGVPRLDCVALGLYIKWHLQMEALDASVVVEVCGQRRIRLQASNGGIDAGCWWLFTTRRDVY